MIARKLLAALVLLMVPALHADGLNLLRITPAGEEVEPTSQQIVLSFDRAVVQLGRMARSADEVPRSMIDPATSVSSIPPAVPRRPVRSSCGSDAVAIAGV